MKGNGNRMTHLCMAHEQHSLTARHRQSPVSRRSFFAMILILSSFAHTDAIVAANFRQAARGRPLSSLATRFAASLPCRQNVIVSLMQEEGQTQELPTQDPLMQPDRWQDLALRERFPRLQNLSFAILAKRTVEEAELAIKLEREFQNDASILQDIDFSTLSARLEQDLNRTDAQLRGTGILTDDELDALQAQQRRAVELLGRLAPKYRNVTTSGAVAEAVPKIRRVIVRARELPLTVELPTDKIVGPEGFDVQLVLKESKNLAVAAKEVWQRLNGVSPTKEEELSALQKESAALLSLRAEATKLRNGIRLVQRQKELKASYLIRSDSEDLLEETLRADVSIAKLQKELSLKAARLELERIFITLESELSSNSALVPELLPAVKQYGKMEDSLINMVQVLQQGRLSAIDQDALNTLERDIAQQLLLLGLQDQNTDGISAKRMREELEVNLKRLQQGLQFYGRGIQLLGQDVQLLINMLTRAITKGYTLRNREVKLLRRIAKDLLTIVPFVIILIIPLTPLGHVLVFSFIQRFFPDFFPSQFTEGRQNIMSMYSSITTPGAADLQMGSVIAAQSASTSEASAEVKDEGAPEEPQAAAKADAGSTASPP